MKPKPQFVPTEFGPEVSFPVKTQCLLRKQQAELEKLKDLLLRARLNRSRSPAVKSCLAWAANDAAALALASGYPLLVYPLLFEEKAEEARRRIARQKSIRMRSRPLVEAI